MLNVVCDCGNKKVVRFTSLLGTTKSCGCLNTKNRHTNTKTHGCTGTRLHRCWKSMKTRCRIRGDSCNHCIEWENFEPFRRWALLNGYSDDKVLCRNGDVGLYEPSNCRWDTTQSNIIESNSKVYTVTTPDGETLTIKNLSAFERDNNLPVNKLNSLANGKVKERDGWRCEHAQ